MSDNLIAQIGHLILAPALLAFVGAVIWFVRLEGRVNLLDRILGDHLADSKVIFREFQILLHRVEEKVDKLTLRCVATTRHLHYRSDDPDRPPDSEEPPNA